MTVGERLRRAREKKKLNQMDVAKLTNINNKSLSRYEKDLTEPSFDTLRLLADVYEVPMAYFFDGEITKTYDLEELLKEKKLTWGGEELDEEEAKKAIEILNILLKKQKDTN
ncbi:helix-turn-helix domain-containing protein [Mesobacillus zeae]|uniref:XRE family transcriptional regulator n=1 Tax=Mesobacillus zeae TaxID=1917180 RepID=A0A398B6A3_9BACI|nr:helix-turn-helix transcriptional regulator [Mesobacillus zeae]RID85629.1 XRE family transcriptional regulator [Mesobacillus zeae]